MSWPQPKPGCLGGQPQHHHKSNIHISSPSLPDVSTMPDHLQTPPGHPNTFLHHHTHLTWSSTGVTVPVAIVTQIFGEHFWVSDLHGEFKKVGPVTVAQKSTCGGVEPPKFG